MPNSNYRTDRDFPSCSASDFENFPERAVGEKEGVGTDNELLVLEPKTKTKKPPFYKVVMLNDDYTPMDFVVQVLKDIFRMDHKKAINTMLEVHHKGAGLCGVFTRDVAETKVELVVANARQHDFPLQCVMEMD